VETIQNDVRQAMLLFMCDFANPYFKDHPLFEEAVDRYEPLKGHSAVQAILQTKEIIEIIAVLGGQWPHSSFMVPGGVVTLPASNDLTQCRHLAKSFLHWYEKQVLGCSLERWNEIKSLADLENWLEESPSHQNSELGFFLRFSRHAQLDRLGKGHGNFINFGFLDMPRDTSVQAFGDGEMFIPAGFFEKNKLVSFDPEQITEDLSYSRFIEDMPRHPFNGITAPLKKFTETRKYSWNKAPRYNGMPAETGPLSQMLTISHPLFADIYEKKGPSVFLRELARILRPAILLPVLDTWIKEIQQKRKDFFTDYKSVKQCEGYGLIDAPRGALGHWLKIRDGKIAGYQVITPTSWNASPRDGKRIRGPWEEALVGTEIRDPENPLEPGLVVRSFDPCQVCAVHVVDKSAS
jgi:hydrogenase large subunit